MPSSPEVNTLRFVLSITTTFGVAASKGLIPVYVTILGIPAFTTLLFEGITIKESGYILTTFGFIAILSSYFFFNIRSSWIFFNSYIAGNNQYC